MQSLFRPRSPREASRPSPRLNKPSGRAAGASPSSVPGSLRQKPASLGGHRAPPRLSSETPALEPKDAHSGTPPGGRLSPEAARRARRRRHVRRPGHVTRRPGPWRPPPAPPLRRASGPLLPGASPAHRASEIPAAGPGRTA